MCSYLSELKSGYVLTYISTYTNQLEYKAIHIIEIGLLNFLSNNIGTFKESYTIVKHDNSIRTVIKLHLNKPNYRFKNINTFIKYDLHNRM